MATDKFKAMSGLLGLAVAALALPVQAGSADGWSGCHVGGHAGYGWAKIEGWSDTNPADHPSIGSTTASGGALGAQLALSKADIRGSHPYAPTGSGPADRVTYDIQWLATLTGRAGYLLRPGTLAYLKAGAAWTRTNHDDSDPAPLGGVPYTGNKTATRHGWVAGIGLEQRLDRQLSTYVEYSYLDFGKQTVSIDYSDGATFAYPFQQRINYLGAGLNYRF